MPTVPYPNFVGPAYRLASSNAAGDRCVNLYPQTIQSGTGKGKNSLEMTPGLVAFGTLPATPCRGLFAGDNRLFAVAADNLYEVSSVGVSTLIGAMGGAATTPASFFSNGLGTQLLIVTGSQIWVSNGGAPSRPSYGTLTAVVATLGTVVNYFSGDKFTPTMVGTLITINAVAYTVANYISDTYIQLTTSAGIQTGVTSTWTDFVLGVAGAYLGGYFIILTPNSNVINVSNLNNGLTWDALDYQQRISRPDRIRMLFVVGENLWLFGGSSCEAWYLTDQDFPLTRIEGSLMDYGIWAPYSVAAVGDNSLMWLSTLDGELGSVKLVNSLKASTVSTYAVDYAIQQYATSTDAVAYSYTANGHVFYVLNFPSVGKTWVYDLSENAWHERAYTTALAGQLQRFHASTFSEDIVGAGGSGAMFYMRSSAYTDAGATIRRIRQAPHISEEQLWSFYSYFQLDADVGDVPSTAPDITLEISNDGGKTFGTPITIAMGAIGEYTKRVKWNRLGRSRDRVFKVTCDAAVFQSWCNAYLKVEPGTGT